MTDPIYEEYKDWDMSNARPVSQIPALQKLQAQHKTEQSVLKSAPITSDKLLDDDVENWLVQQNQDTKHLISDMIRNVMNIQRAFVS